MEKYELKAANTAFRFFIIPLHHQTTNSPDDQTSVGGDLQSPTAQLARVAMPVCQYVSCERTTTGTIKMTTPTKGATIWYSIDGGAYQQYTTLLRHDDACTVSAYCSAEGLLDSPVTTFEFPLFVDKSKWKLVSVDSQQGGNEARLAFDSKPSTFWHTQWGAVEPKCPHTIVIDMVTTYNVKAVTYLSRQDGNQNGMVKAYEIYLSLDGNTWGQAAATGELVNTTSLQTIIVGGNLQSVGGDLQSPTYVAARYLKFVAKSEINGNAWTSAAEIGIEAEPYKETGMKGDVNGDGAVDVADISAIIGVMAGTPLPPSGGDSGGSGAGAADVNGDGTVDVADISAVITIMAEAATRGLRE